MKKFVIGLIVGAAIMFSSQIYGASSLLGSKVAGTMKVNLSQKDIGDAVIINDSSYIPVRTFTDTMNFKVEVKDRVINLTPAPIDPVKLELAKRQSSLNQKKFDIEQSIKSVNARMERMQTVIERNKNGLSSDREEYRKVAQKNTDDANAALVELQDMLNDLNTQLSDVNPQITALEAELEAQQQN